MHVCKYMKIYKYSIIEIKIGKNCFINFIEIYFFYKRLYLKREVFKEKKMRFE